MAKNVKPTTKNSPAIKAGKAPFNKPASDYAAPHKMTGAPLSAESFQAEMDAVPYARTKSAATANIKDPLSNGVSWGQGTVKTDGIEMRGAGAATKGRISRGPMA